MGKSCKEIAQSLVECMKQTNCVQIGGDVRKCLSETDDCQEYRNAYFTCRRSGLDMRTRIKGQKVY